MYYSRLVEKEIELKLKTSGAVVVAGPKFCGKTTTCMLYQKSYVKLNTKQSITMARMNPKGVLGGEKPRLIDEWQKAPDIWNQVKDDLDFEYQFGKYILTGSSTPADKTEVHHSGAGRITPVKMRPMSLWESKESKGTISLMDLFDGKNNYPWDMNDEISLNDIASLICRGGWPISVQAPKEIAIEITKNYYNGLFVFEGVDEIEDSAFAALPQLRRIMFPDNPDLHVMKHIFDDSPQLESISFRCKTPLVLGNDIWKVKMPDVFNLACFEHVVLYVPKGSAAAYRRSVWGCFRNIEEYK